MYTYHFYRGYEVSKSNRQDPEVTGLTCTTAIIMPDDVAEEKVKALLSLGADVERVRPASIVDKKQVCPRSPLSCLTS